MCIETLQQLKEKLGKDYIFDIQCERPTWDIVFIERIFSGDITSVRLVNAVLRVGIGLLDTQKNLCEKIQTTAK